MNPMEALQQHQQICDELHAHALAENRFLQQERRPPDTAMLAYKRTLLERLDETLQALRMAPKANEQRSAWRQALDATRARILQILQLERENEQLLLRYSLTGGRLSDPVPGLPNGMLQKIYQRHQ
jgi:hypothetical protein